jgi:FG-GAP repeat
VWFVARPSVSAQVAPINDAWSLAVGDLNADGAPDVMVSNGYSNLAVFANTTQQGLPLSIGSQVNLDALAPLRPVMRGMDPGAVLDVMTSGNQGGAFGFINTSLAGETQTFAPYRSRSGNGGLARRGGSQRLGSKARATRTVSVAAEYCA